MAKDVFISHCAADAAIAIAICDFLETQGIGCWIAPRDVMPGSAFEEQILTAIAQSQAMVLVLSTNSNESPFVKNEVNRAFAQRKPIFTLRAEDVQPSGSLELYLASHHWVDGFPPPLNERLPRFAAAILALIGQTSTSSSASGRAWGPEVPAPSDPDVKPGALRTSEGEPPTSEARPELGSEHVGEVIRRDGSRERFESISLANRYGQVHVLDIAVDQDGKKVRQVELQRVRRIEILGPSGVRDAEGSLLKNCWSLARVHLDSGSPLTNVFVNPHGLGGWAWTYKTELWSGRIDDDVVDIVLPLNMR